MVEKEVHDLVDMGVQLGHDRVDEAFSQAEAFDGRDVQGWEGLDAAATVEAYVGQGIGQMHDGCCRDVRGLARGVV
jgi:hypothetical protein